MTNSRHFTEIYMQIVMIWHQPSRLSKSCESFIIRCVVILTLVPWIGVRPSYSSELRHAAQTISRWYKRHCPRLTKRYRAPKAWVRRRHYVSPGFVIKRLAAPDRAWTCCLSSQHRATIRLLNSHHAKLR